MSEDGKCNHILGDVPGPVRFVGTSATAPKEPGLCIWLMCPRKDCRTWNVFEVVFIAGTPVPRSAAQMARAADVTLEAVKHG